MEKTEDTGERVGGYRVVRRLATGGTSDVLLAKAEGPHGFERSVVLKVLLPKFDHDDDLKAMFAREAAAYARLSHPSIVRLYDFFASGDQLVMVLEYLDGPPLSRLRGMLRTVGRQLDDEAAIHLAASVFDALAAAHAATDDAGAAAPVIHRDVNPSNVLVTWDGQVKLADFGIAKVTGSTHQSSAGLIRGTYGYMAPEQVKGEPVTPRADVYAGAIILWELLTRRRAFIRGALPEIEVLRELAEPRILSIDVLRPDLDTSVREAIKRALVPRAEKRTMTAEEMASTLRAAVPDAEGRESLGKALAGVRHEPKDAPTSMPPPLDLSDDQETHRVLPAGGAAPRPPALPRPAVEVPRHTAPYGLQSGTTPRPPVLGPPRARSFEKEMPASILSPEEVASVIEQGSGASLAPQAEEVGPSSVPGLASILEPSPEDLRSSDRDVKTFDSLVEPHELVAATGRASEKLRLRTPLAGGRPLRDAIDEILRGVPSPQLGELPPAPAPLEPLRRELNATLVTSTGPRPIPSSFPQMSRTLAMHERVDVVHPTAAELADKPTERAPPHPLQATTAPMPAVAPPSLSPSTAKMRAFALPLEALGSVPPPAPGSPFTLPLRGGPPPLPVVTAPGSPAGAPASPAGAPTLGSGASVPGGHEAPRTSVATVPPNRATCEPLPRPPKRIGRVATVLVVVTLVGGIAGTVGYVRWRTTRAPAVIAAPPVAVAVSASATETATATAVPSAVASVASTVASAPSTSATSPSEDVPEGMGRVTTTGTLPGRRIFVDDRTVGQTPDAVVVRCGSRRIKLGSAGATRTVDIPCGGEIRIGDR